MANRKTWPLILVVIVLLFTASQAMAGGDGNDPRGTNPDGPGTIGGGIIDSPPPSPLEMKRMAPLGHGTDEIGPKMILKVLIQNSNQ